MGGGRTNRFCDHKAQPIESDGASKELLGAGATFGSLKVFVQDSQVVAYTA